MSGERIAGLPYGGADGLVGEALTLDGQGAGLEVDVDGRDAPDRPDLGRDGVGAVAAGHSCDGVLRAHGAPRGWLLQLFSRRVMAARASATFSSALARPSSSPAAAPATASCTQWPRWSSTR